MFYAFPFFVPPVRLLYIKKRKQTLFCVHFHFTLANFVSGFQILFYLFFLVLHSTSADKSVVAEVGVRGGVDYAFIAGTVLNYRVRSEVVLFVEVGKVHKQYGKFHYSV